MDRRALLPAALATLGTVAVLVGIHGELLNTRPMYDAIIETGWGGPLNHGERLLAKVAVLGTVGAVAAVRWRRAAVLAQAAGAVVLFYALRAVVNWVLHHRIDVYTGLPVHGGTSGRFVFGTEPYLLVLGGLLLVAGGVAGLRSPVRRSVLTRSRRGSNDGAGLGNGR